MIDEKNHFMCKKVNALISFQIYLDTCIQFHLFGIISKLKAFLIQYYKDKME